MARITAANINVSHYYIKQEMMRHCSDCGLEMETDALDAMCPQCYQQFKLRVEQLHKLTKVTNTGAQSCSEESLRNSTVSEENLLPHDLAEQQLEHLQLNQPGKSES